MKKAVAKKAPARRRPIVRVAAAAHPGDQAQPVAWFVWYCAQATTDSDRRNRETFARKMLRPTPKRAAGAVPEWNPNMVEDVEREPEWQPPSLDAHAPERDVEQPPAAPSIEVDLADLDRSDAAEARIEQQMERATRLAQSRRRGNAVAGSDTL